MKTNFTTYTCRIFLVCSLLFCTGYATAQNETLWTDYASTSFESGTGTISDPILIRTPQQLAKLAVDINSGKSSTDINYKLIADIDLSGHNWIPIGNYQYEFEGNFDGNYHSIFNMTINISGSPNSDVYTGFFGVLTLGSIKNLTIGTGSTIKITTSDTYNNKIYAGGIVAYGSNLIMNCSNHADILISGNAGRYIIGGIAGDYWGLIRDCYNAGTIDFKSNSQHYLGGIIGQNEGIIINCYSSGNTKKPNIQDDTTGAVIGFNEEGVIMNSYFLQDNTINSGLKGIGTYSFGTGTVTALTADQLKATTMPEILNATTYNMRWDTDKNNTNNGYPVLSNRNYQNWTWTGDGTKESPWIISNPQQLNELSLYCLNSYTTEGKYWQMNADIDMSTIRDFIPIGGFIDITTCPYSNYFKGNFDGNGHTIRNLIIKLTTASNSVLAAGLFGLVFNGGTVKNVVLGSGSSVAIHNTTDGDCYFYAGGIAAGNVGTIENCINTAPISITSTDNPDLGYNTNYAGGIVGNNFNSVNNCYNLGSVVVKGNDSNYSGGIVGLSMKYEDQGYIYNATLSNCYNLATNISCTLNKDCSYGAIVGKNDNGTVSNCFYLQDATNNNLTGIGSGTGEATAKTSDELRLAAMVNTLNNTQNPAPWISDFNPAINNGYPILWWQKDIVSQSPSVTTSTLQIYPNPAHNYIRIHGIEGNQKYQISDMTGQTVLSGVVKEGEAVRISSLAAGMYTISINGNSAKLIVK